MHREDIKNYIQCAIWVQVKVAYQTDDLFPNGARAFLDCCVRLHWTASGWGVCGAETACEFRSEFRVTLGLFAEQIKLVLFVAFKNFLRKDSTLQGMDRRTTNLSVF